MSVWREDRLDGPDGDGPEADGVTVARRRGATVWRQVQIALLLLIGLFVLAVAIAYLERRPIADNILSKELAKKSVQASYHLDKVGLRTQIVSNLVIGDPAHPDLIARTARVDLRIGLSGAITVYRVTARGVRLRAAVIGRRVSFGQLDRLMPAPSNDNKPFALPNIVVDVADATVALTTPYGPVGLALAGVGNLSGGFRGRLAVAANRLAPGRCAVDGLKASLAVAVDARRPYVTGPLSATSFACPPSGITATAPRIDLDSRFNEGFGQFDGHGRLSAASFVAGSNGVANFTSLVGFAGTPTHFGGRIKLDAQRGRLAKIFTDRTLIDGQYSLDARAGTLAMVAAYDADGVTPDAAMTASLLASLRALKASPVGPVAEGLAQAVVRNSRKFDVDGTLRLVNFNHGGGVRIETALLNSPTGAHIRLTAAGGDGVSYYWPTNRIRLDGRVRTGGGGLPVADLTIRQPRSGGPISGVATMQPYVSNGGRLALAQVRFVANAAGETRINTVAVIDGPLAGARVTGLTVPVDGTLGQGGSLAFGQGCINTSFATLTLGSLHIGATRLPMCATRGAILSKPAGGALDVSGRARNLALAGRIGTSPFRLTAASASLAGLQRFNLDHVAFRLGPADRPLAIDANQVSGAFAGGLVTGRYGGGQATIGNVPLLVSDSAGKWNLRGAALALDGAGTVSDRTNPARFVPLHTADLHLTLAGDWVKATAGLDHPATGTRIVDVNIRHRLSSGAGEALLDVHRLTFGPRLQPDDLTPLTNGVIALVNGSVRGQGRIAWTDESVTSTGDFDIDKTALAASFGPVTGLAGHIHFTDLLALQTAPGQRLTIDTINPGILVERGVVHYQLLPDQLVKVERGQWPFMGGTLILHETVLNLGKPSPKRLTFEVVAFDSHRFIETMEFREINATGLFDGVLPMIFDENGGRIVGGRLDSRAAGGNLAYNGVVNRANLGLFGGVAFDALKDLRYRTMIVRLDGALDGEFATRLAIDQVALGNATKTQRFIKSINKIPFKFNVTIKGPFRALIATAKSFEDPTQTINDVVPLADTPGLVTTIRRDEEQKTQTQTPVHEVTGVGQKITVTPSPPKGANR